MEYFAFFHIYLISNNKSLSEYWNEYRNGQRCLILFINPFKPAFTIVIFIHYKPRIAAAILDL